MKDFFISYTHKDELRATWIAEVLEKNNYTVTIQAWDFMAGDNFVEKIDVALIECNQLIVVLSSNYLKSKWCKAEWTSKLSEQIRTGERKIIPIRIENIDVNGLLGPISYIDIYDSNETESEKRILEGINPKRERKSTGFVPNFSCVHKSIRSEFYVYDERIVYKKTVETIANVDGKDREHNRVTWFPDETIKVTSLTDGITIQELNLPDTNFNYNVVFDHPIKKGETITYSVRTELSNKQHHFKNFFSAQIITPVEELDITLFVFDKNIEKVYTQKISSSPLNTRTEEKREKPYVDSFRWIINNPEINFEYVISW